MKIIGNVMKITSVKSSYTYTKFGVMWPIDPRSKQKHHILVWSDYLTMWTEVKDMKNENEENVAKFFHEGTFSRFWVLREIVANQGPQFTSNLIENLMQLNKICHRESTTYHSQENSEVEVTNRKLENILTKIV